MIPLAVNTIPIDLTFVITILIVVLGVIGLNRGMRTESITLAGILATTVVIFWDTTRAQFVSLINRVPRAFNLLTNDSTRTNAPSLLADNNTTLLVLFLLFVLAVFVFYKAGDRFGAPPANGTQKLVGGLMGAASGFIIGWAAVRFIQDWLALNPGSDTTSIELVTLPASGLPSLGILSQYALVIFIGLFVLLAIYVFANLRKSR